MGESTRQLELTATPTFERHRFANASGDVVILSARGEDNGDGRGGEFALKGPADGREPKLRMPYRFYGHWSSYTNQRTGETEKQFHFKTFSPCATPKGEHAIVSYLSNAPGLGRVISSRLYKEYGESAVEALRDRPGEVASKIPRISNRVAEAASAWLQANAALESVMIEMTGLLQGRGLPRNIARDAVKRWGNRAPEIIRRNPYRLMASMGGFYGVGFKRADALFLEFGHNPARLKRQALCAWHAVSEAANGDTWLNAEVAIQGVKGAIGGAAPQPKKALRLAVRGGLLAAQYTDGRDGPPDVLGDCAWYADERKARAERELAAIVRGMLGRLESIWQREPWEDNRGLSKHQSFECRKATSRRLGILGGGPGTGKTFAVAKLVESIGQEYGLDQVAICALAGKAAVRCTEAMHAAGVPVTARTIHSTLGVEWIEGGGSSFAHGKHCPLPYRFVIVDESSMVDTTLMLDLFRALPRGGHVLLVGDTGQLLPVGHGAPLRDLIAAGVPYGELSEVRRNSGAIVEACHAIRQGKPFEVSGNLAHVTGGDVAGVVQHAASEQGIDPVWGVQVVTATNDHRTNLNAQLQAALNLNPKNDSPFRLADKVVCLRNSWFSHVGEPGPGCLVREKAGGSAEVYVANGELGAVVEMAGKRLKVQLDSPRRVVWVPLGKPVEGEGGEGGGGCNFDLAYCLSVHKSQGSEFPVVVVALDDSGAANRVGDRAWLYTAISRAKQQCVLWGDLSVARKWVRRDRISARKTFLEELVGGV